MNDIKLYAFTLFCCSCAAGFIDFLAPESLKKQLSCITGMLILLCMLSPVRAMSGNMPLPPFGIEPVQSQSDLTDELLKEEFELRLTKIIEDILSDSGIFDADIGIEITISGDEVSVGQIEVTLNDGPARESEVQRLLEQSLGMEVSVGSAGR